MTKFCMLLDFQDLITSATFGDNRLSGLGVARGRNSRFPVDLRRRPYNARTVWLVPSPVILYAVAKSDHNTVLFPPNGSPEPNRQTVHYYRRLSDSNRKLCCAITSNAWTGPHFPVSKTVQQWSTTFTILYYHYLNTSCLSPNIVNPLQSSNGSPLSFVRRSSVDIRPFHKAILSNNIASETVLNEWLRGYVRPTSVQK